MRPLVEPGPALSADDRARFGRHVILPGIGEQGQRRLRNTRVAVIGAGGLGSPVLLYLAAAGVGRITVVDDDVVDLSNLQRQVLHGTGDVGRPKVESAADAVHHLDPAVELRLERTRLTAANALDLLAGHDVVVDGSDNFATRYLAGDACELLGLPCVWGAILRFEGQVSVFWAGHGPVYRDIFPDSPDPDLVPSCAQAGVLGVICASIGAAMATEVVKLVTGVGTPLLGRLLTYDALDARWRELTVRPDPAREPVTEITEPAVVCDPRDARIHDVRDLADLAETPGVVVVDVRTPEEIALQPGPGTVFVVVDDIDSIDLPRDTPVVLVCASGVRSRRAARRLVDAGFTDVHDLLGGVTAWARPG